MFKDDEKHSDMVTETIIECMMNSDKITYLYNSLNGFSNEVNFKVGELINSKDTTRFRKEGQESAEYQEIGDCEIIEIDQYRREKLSVKFDTYDSDGKLSSRTTWVDHIKCDKLSSKEIMEHVGACV